MKILFFFLFIWVGVLEVGADKVILEHKNGSQISNSSHPPLARTFTTELGTTFGSLYHLNDQPPMNSRIVIFLGSPASLDGKVGAWEFFTVEVGSFCLGVFHHSKSLDGKKEFLQFGGCNCFQVLEDSPRLTLYEIPHDHRLSVKSNSVVAIIYPSKNSPRCVTMETQRQPMSRTVQSYPDIMVINPGDLTEDQGGYFLLPATTVERVAYGNEYKGPPSFKAIIIGPTTKLLLRGNNKYSGVAMIYLNNQWGTVCDKWFHSKGWPQLFCEEKDYPSTEVVTYNEGEHKVDIPPGTPILMYNPHCKESANGTLTQCVTREDQLCNHTEDVFIVCHKRVKLLGVDNKFDEGICMVYEDNYWGLVCDSRGIPKDLGQNGTLGAHHWAHACCREVGFKNGVTKLDWAFNRFQVPPAHAVSLRTPVCAPETVGGEVDDIDMCQDGPAEEPSCTSDEALYLYCDTSVYQP